MFGYNIQPISDSQELLFSGCRELDIKKVKQAIEDGVDVNKKSPIKLSDEYIYNFNVWYSPLCLVAKSFDSTLTNEENDVKAKEIASVLLENKANVDLLDKGDMGNSALHWSIVKKKKQLSLLLISHAIENNKQIINLVNNPDEISFGKNTPLILALKIAAASLLKNNEYDLDVVKTLLSTSIIDVNQSDSNKQSALHWACMLRAPKYIFELLHTRHCIPSLNEFDKLPEELYEAQLNYGMMNENPTSFSDIDYHLPDWYSLDTKEERAKRKEHRVEFAQKRNQLYDEDCLEILNTMLSLAPRLS